jgi:hypothetical protein
MIVNSRPNGNYHLVSRVKEVLAVAEGNNFQARCMKCRRETPALAKRCIEVKKCLK